ncbi:MAG: cysteine synthase A [Candidatus Anstonellales archaeon]
MVPKGILDTIGNTPMIKIGEIYAKLEAANPSGSIKDRMAWHMVKKAEKQGKLKKGMHIIEATSGNTGISFAMISAARGYKFTAVMPESMSMERTRMMKAFGADVILTPAEEDMAGAVKRCLEIAKKLKNVWLPSQFENPDNPESFRLGLGKEILAQMPNIDAFVAGVGTGGTLIGAAQALKKKRPSVRIIAVEPRESALLSGGKPGLHEIEGIGEGFIPEIVSKNIGLIDEVIRVSSREAIIERDRLAKEEGIFVGTSSGANVLAAKKVAKRLRNVVTVLPDRGERYLSVMQQKVFKQ